MDVTGYYVQASYFLSGERRPYMPKPGKFSVVHPHENWNGRNFAGAWELAARYSAVDYDDGDFVNDRTGNTGAKAGNITVGLNYYLNPYARVMLNYVHGNYEDDVIDDEAMNALMMRFQVHW